MLDPAWWTALAALATVCGGLLLWLFRHLWRVLRRITRFLDDFFGEPAREGLPAKPGVMARLASVETIAEKVAAEMTVNHGGSMRDAVNAMGADVTSMQADITHIRKEQGRLREQVSNLRKPAGGGQ